jgi:AsmA protein
MASGVLKSGIPVAIGGTTSNPTFTPDLSRVAASVGASAAQGLIKGKTGQTPANGNPLGGVLGGLLGKH